MPAASTMAVPAGVEEPSTNSSTRLPGVRPAPEKTGEVELVWPAVELGLIGEMVGAAGVAGATVSITTVSGSEAGPVTPAIEVYCAVKA